MKSESLVFSLEFLPLNPADSIKIAKLVEKYNFNNLWVSDAAFYSDVFATVSTILFSTKRVNVGPGVTNPFTRHPVYLGLALTTLNVLSGGRVLLGLGTGDYNTMKSLDVLPEKPIGALKESVEILRKIINNEKFSFNGTFFKVRNFHMSYKNPTPIPIYMGAKGPKMLKTAGEIADGVLLDEIPLEVMPSVFSYIKEGAKRAKKSLDDLHIINSIFVTIDNNDKEKALRSARRYTSYTIASLPEYMVKLLKIDRQLIKNIRSKLPNLKSVIEEIPLELVEKFTIVGDSDYCLEKIIRYKKLGVNEIALITVMHDDLDMFLKTFHKKIICSM